MKTFIDLLAELEEKERIIENLEMEASKLANKVLTLEREKSNVTIKGDLIKNIFITSTMGVSYKIKLSKNI